jgi:hypothetical protein
MTEQHDLTARQQDYAVFLPAISSFYSTYIGRQRFENYVDPARMPAAMPDMEQMNFLNPQQALFPYKWALYSAGHADLDLTKHNPKEDMIRNRDSGVTMLCDSGGFQIAKGVWEGDWRSGSGCAKAQKKREAVLKWQDGIATYGLTLDIPTWTSKWPGSSEKTGIYNYEDAVNATIYNNDYFIDNRRGVAEGGARYLNVLQGADHGEADAWYDIMKHYSDPARYPGRHFNGWGMGGQNMCDVHLVLKRIVTLIHDGLLEPGVHDWMHFLGTSKLEWACLLTDIQRAVRRYHNPNFTISFDCASPFLATANGQLYYQSIFPNRDKWTYRMAPTADNKRYASDQRSFRDAVIQDGIHSVFDDSPISQRLKISDVCVYGPGDLNKLGKEGKTSWDSFSYALMMGHNVWHHINAVQTANELYDQDQKPGMLAGQYSSDYDFRNIVEEIFHHQDRERSLAAVEHYRSTCDLIIGTRGRTGKRMFSATTMFNSMFEFDDAPATTNDDDLDPDKLDELEATL